MSARLTQLAAQNMHAPHLIDGILGQCDPVSQARCLRGSSRRFHLAGPHLYRDLKITARSPPHPAWHAPACRLKRRLVPYTRRIVVGAHKSGVCLKNEALHKRLAGLKTVWLHWTSPCEHASRAGSSSSAAPTGHGCLRVRWSRKVCGLVARCEIDYLGRDMDKQLDPLKLKHSHPLVIPPAPPELLVG
ncbi:hypothetical protein Q5752_000154 [Cryptotrichosporon argae]